MQESHKKSKPVCIRLSPKVMIYLSRLGFVDRRNNTVKKNFSQFVNECIINNCESSMIQGLQATDQELIHAYKKHCMIQLTKEQLRIEKELQFLKETGLSIKINN